MEGINYILFFAEILMDEREQNGPTQVHPALNYNELTAHMQLNGMNGLNGGMVKPFAERGKYILVILKGFGKIFITLNWEKNVLEKTRDEKFSL